jgi:hypothetical protein
MLTIEYAKDPYWNSDDGQQIHLTVKFAEFANELPFTAASFDEMPHGVELYNRAKNGEFGAIGPYVPPAEPPADQPTTTGSQNL